MRKLLRYFRRHGDAAVQILHHHGAAQQALEDAVILPVIVDQVGRPAPQSRTRRSDVLPQRRRPGRRSWAGRWPARRRAASGSRWRPCRPPPVHHDVLHARRPARSPCATVYLSCRLASGWPPGRGCPAGAFFSAACITSFTALEKPSYSFSISVSRRMRFSSAAASMVSCNFSALRIGGALFAAFHLQAVSLNDVADGLRLLPGFVEKLPVLSATPSPLCSSFSRAAVSSPAVCSRRSSICAHAGSAGRTAPPCRRRRRTAAAPPPPAGPPPCGQRPPRCRSAPVPLPAGRPAPAASAALCLIDLADALQLGIHLRLQAARPVLRVLHLPLNARDALIVVLHRGAAAPAMAAVMLAGGGSPARLTWPRSVSASTIVAAASARLSASAAA